jgi:hypothetical protein
MTTEFTIELPEAWRTAPFRPAFIEVLAEVELPRGRTALIVMGLLKDGTNILALTWDRGTRLARTCPDNGWALEERFTGPPPGRREGALIKAWQVGIEAMIQAGKDAQAEMSEPGWEPTPAVFVMNNEDALEAAWQEYQQQEDATPLTREQFEAGIELLARAETEGKRKGTDA